MLHSVGYHGSPTFTVLSARNQFCFLIFLQPYRHTVKYLLSLSAPASFSINFPCVTKCFNSFHLIICPKNTGCLFLASLTNDLVVPVLSSTSSFIILSTYAILSSLRRNHISVAFNLFSISLRIVYASQPYINTANSDFKYYE